MFPLSVRLLQYYNGWRFGSVCHSCLAAPAFLLRPIPKTDDRAWHELGGSHIPALGPRPGTRARTPTCRSAPSSLSGSFPRLSSFHIAAALLSWDSRHRARSLSVSSGPSSTSSLPRAQDWKSPDPSFDRHATRLAKPVSRPLTTCQAYFFYFFPVGCLRYYRPGDLVSAASRHVMPMGLLELEGRIGRMVFFVVRIAGRHQMPLGLGPPGTGFRTGLRTGVEDSLDQSMRLRLPICM
ncbi:hypothetical protein BT67DRAFT_111403 [Trichocladium antarcticum]|uniref:Uncharacterized protein n=1 Tax=Trichocladium antarcticum TaxID=1450529 RepID=A0AAN6ZH92_9PEZI|nr:hypothetical protein BT67DRAFT_111403 [Trichocladium antarcticum]